jgi:hypothetical protein
MRLTVTNRRETWLRPNQRALWFGMIVPSVGTAVGAWLVLATEGPVAAWRMWLGTGLLVVFGFIASALLVHMRRPRIAYRDGEVLFFLGSASPIAVPAEIVEAFFIGQQPLNLPGRPPGRHATMNLVARLTQRATDWSRRDVKPALGRWCDGYVTIRGTWCEPINGELIRRLNHRLREVNEETKSMKEDR